MYGAEVLCDPDALVHNVAADLGGDVISVRRCGDGGAHGCVDGGAHDLRHVQGRVEAARDIASGAGVEARWQKRDLHPRRGGQVWTVSRSGGNAHGRFPPRLGRRIDF